MPSSPSPLDRQPAPFDRKILRRSVIAVPLADAIEEELELTDEWRHKYADALGDVDTAVFLRGDAGLTAESAVDALRHLLDEALRDVGGREGQRIDGVHAVDGQLIALGHLDGLVIQRMLSIDAAATGRAPLIDRIWPTRFDVIIDINLNFKPSDWAVRPAADPQSLVDQLDVRVVAKQWIKGYIDEAKQHARTGDPDQGIDFAKTRLSPQYVFARLEGRVIQELVAIDERESRAKAAAELDAARAKMREALGPAETARRLDDTTEDEIARHAARFRTIHHIWPDFRLQSCITRSISTVKVDAAHRSFTALGENITWAVVDSGVAADHSHFREYENIDPASPYHADFTGLASDGSALRDEYGHGTHVAGIIAGARARERGGTAEELTAVWPELGQGGKKAELRSSQIDTVSGMAPKAKIVSLKVLDRFGGGMASSVITAIAHIQAINHNGRELHIHGVNLSLGYPFDPKWFACGHSPLCVEVNRLVKSGVVVVVAAGNTGYGTLLTKEGQSDASLDLTINDPGNAEYAITVGSTHRDEPHRYGVSYFSSKGPTGDGRYKPDLLAPGERIISCAAKGAKLVVDEAGDQTCTYFESSGTSMAAPHVSGAIAAFLSIRREFIGEPEKVKQVFCSTATDLGRDRYFQGSGLVDLMRAIQSV
jgi:subtilisin family serine protease